MLNNSIRRIFWLLNKFFMVPMFRLGFAPFMGTPFGGYIMVIKTVGRKTGKVRYAPVNYTISNGSIYCMAGFGRISDWYRNIKNNPSIELMMPSGAIAGQVEEATDPEERRLILRQILKNAGFAGFFEGFNPFTVTDIELLSKTEGLPLLRIRPVGLGNGASDPGGWAWIWGIVATIAIVIALIVCL